MVNTYYTRAQARFVAAPRSRRAEKNLAAGLRRERATRAITAAALGEMPRGMGYYQNEIGHAEWLVIAGFAGPQQPRLWGMEVGSDGPDV